MSWCWGQGVLALGTAVSAVTLLRATVEGSQICRHPPPPPACWEWGRGRMGSPYLLQQQSVLVALGQVAGSERALDAGPNDNDIVGGFLGLAWGSHVRPRPCFCLCALWEVSQGEERGRVQPSRAGGGALATSQLCGDTGATLFLPLGAGQAGTLSFPHLVPPGQAAQLIRVNGWQRYEGKTASNKSPFPLVTAGSSCGGTHGFHSCANGKPLLASRQTGLFFLQHNLLQP